MTLAPTKRNPCTCDIHRVQFNLEKSGDEKIPGKPGNRPLKLKSK